MSQLGAYRGTLRRAAFVAMKESAINPREFVSVLAFIRSNAAETYKPDVEVAYAAAKGRLEENVAGFIDWENFDQEDFIELVKIILQIIALISALS